MAVSKSALITRTRSWLGEVPIYTTTATAASSSSTITVSDGTRWAEGSILEFQDNGEQARVKSISVNTLTCDRGWNGTTAAAHSSIEAWRDPQFTYQQIDDALDWAIGELWPYVWKVTEDTITPSTTATWYDLDALAVDLVSVRQQYGTSDSKIASYSLTGVGGTRQVQFATGLPTGLVTSGTGVAFPNGFVHPTNTVRIRYRTYITGSSDIPDDAGVRVDEVVILGALSRLAGTKEAERVILGEDKEVERSVPVSSRLRAGAFYESQFYKKLHTLKIRYSQLYPKMVM